MKQLSIVLNLVLLAAVGFLYYLHFSEKKPAEVKAKPGISTMHSKPDTSTQRHGIAYVELDSLMEKISYVKNKRKLFEGEQQSIEAEWTNGMRGLEAQKNEFMKKASTVTQEEAEKFQAHLYEEQQKIENRKQVRSQSLNENSYSFMEKLQKDLKEFLADYNEERSYKYIFSTGNGLEYMLYKDSTMNITQDVIDGMNEKMRESSKK